MLEFRRGFFGERLFMLDDLSKLLTIPELRTDKEVQEIVLHIIVVLMSAAVFFGGILVGLFYVCKSAYAWLRHMRAS
jgi:hypothetical protein